MAHAFKPLRTAQAPRLLNGVEALVAVPGAAVEPGVSKTALKAFVRLLARQAANDCFREEAASTFVERSIQ